MLAKSRAYYQANADVRARRNEYKRLYRQAHPELVREQKRRYLEKHRARVTGAYVKYHARYKRRHAGWIKQVYVERRERADRRPIPVCAECGKATGWTLIPGAPGRPWSTCMRCCWPHQRRQRRKNRRAAVKRAAIAAALPQPKPLPIVPPKRVTRRGPRYERLCLTPGCDVVVSHRKKKCTKCRDAARARAIAVLTSKGYDERITENRRPKERRVA